MNIQFPEITQNYNEKLEMLISRSQDRINHPIILRSNSLITKIWHQFLRFIAWLTGKKNAAASNEELKLRYAMHLFHTLQPELLQQNENREPALPLWQALQFRVDFLKQCRRDIGLESPLLQNMENAVDIAKQLHAARLSSAAERRKIVAEMQSTISEGLNRHGSVLIPGGLLHYDDVTGAFQSLGIQAINTMPSQMKHLLYDVEKVEGEQLRLRIYDLSEEIPDETTYTIPPQAFDEILKTLLDIQTAPHDLHHESWLGRFRYGWALSKNLFSTSHLLESTYFQEGFAADKFEKLIGRIKRENQVAHLNTLEVETTAAKILSFFSKSMDGGNAKFIKTSEKVILFLEIFESYKNELDDPLISRWLQNSALSLLKSLRHNKEHFDPHALPLFNAKISEICRRLADRRNEVDPVLPGVHNAMADSPGVFPEVFRFEEEIVPLEKFIISDATEIKTIAPLRPIDFRNSFEVIFVEICGWMQKCHRLSADYQLEALSYLIKDINNHLLQADEVGFWDNIPLEGTCLDDMSLFLCRIISYQTQIQIGLRKPGPLPQQILHSFKNLERCQHIIYRKNDQNCFEGFALDMDFFKEILKDPWLDLDCYGPAIYKTLQNIEGREKRLVNLTDPSPIEEQSVNNRQFFTSYHAARCPQANLETLPSDFTPLLSRSLVNLRQMKILLLASMARYRTLGSPQFTKVMRESFTVFLDYYRNKVDDIDTEMLRKNFEQIDLQLNNRRLPGRMGITRFSLFKNRPLIELKPYGLAFFQPDHTYNDSLGEPFDTKKIPSQYKTTAQEVLPAVAREVIEGAVANEDFKFVDEDGINIDPASIPNRKHRYVPPGLQSTEGAIIHTSRPHLGIAYDVWADIRLAQTSPKATRIPNTLSLFLKYPHLLTNHRYGPSFQRLFRLNLFRANSLGAFISSEPHRLGFFTERLRTLYQTFLAKNDIEGMLFLLTVIRDAADVVGTHAGGLREMVAELERHLDEWKEQCERSPRLLPHRRSIYQAFLLKESKKENLSNDDKLLSLLKCYFYVLHIEEPGQKRNRCHEEQIHNLIHRIAPLCNELYNQNPYPFHLLLDTISGLQNGNWKRSGETLCFESDDIEIDLKEGQLYKNSLTESFLPDAITHDPACHLMFGKDKIFDIITKKAKIYFNKQRGTKYEFQYKNQPFTIILLPGHRKFIYKKFHNSWFQLQELNGTENATGLPRSLFSNFFWISTVSSKFVVENSDMEPLFYGSLDAKRSCIEKLQTPHELSVLNPWENPDFERFLAITTPTNVYAIGKGTIVSEIFYHQFDLSYVWNPQKTLWICPRFSDYYLSTMPLEQALHPGTERDFPGAFFAKGFNHYHLLLHEKAPALLLIPDFEYCRKPSSLEVKNIRTLSEPVPGQDTAHLYVYELDLMVGLKTDSPEGYLYLAYLLFTQHKYDLALNYIIKARGIEPSSSKSCQRILKLFEKWPAKSDKASIIRLHLGMLVMANTSPNLPGEPNYGSLAAQLQHLVPLIEKYNELSFKNKVPHNLKITNKQKKALLGQVNLAAINMYSQAALTNSVLAHLKNSAIGENLQKLTPKISESLKKYGSSAFLLKGVLDNEIAYLYENLIPPEPVETAASNEDSVLIDTSAQPKGSVFESIFPDTFHDKLMDIQPENHEENLNTILDIGIKIQDPFTKELYEEITHDILLAKAKAPSKQLTEDSHIAQLLEMSTHHRDALEQNLHLKLHFIHSFLKSAPGLSDPISEVIDSLKKQTQTQDHYINKMIYASARDNWDDLITSGVVDNEKIPELKIAIQNYLIVKTALQQCKKLIEAIALYGSTKDPLHKERIAAILLQKRFYDPSSDLLRFFLLLIENDQKIIATERQIDHFKALAKQKDIFKHEALAGGKTSILRNLIAAHNADGVHLSTVITAETLIERHHPLLKKTTEEAYGKKCFRIKFERNDPSDGVSLRILLRNLLIATVSGHRIDLTRKDGLSLHHAFLLKLEELEKSQPLNAKIIDEIDILSKIMILLKEHAAAITDEMDSVITPLIEHNYALGERQQIDPNRLRWYLDWMEWILKDHDLSVIFKNNDQFKLTKEALRGITDGLSSTRQALMEHTFYQRNNVHYIRSSDGITVKPALITDYGIIPNEIAEFGTEDEAILYTCFNYLHTGVTPTQIESMVTQEQQNASDELLKSIQDKKLMTYAETEVAKRFQRDFNINLLDAAPQDFASIAGKINEDPTKLKQFLKNRVFPHINLCGQRLSGSSYDFIHLFKHFSGSSGTPNSYRVLPPKLRNFLDQEKNRPYRRQPGVDGAILSAIISTFDFRSDLILVNGSSLEENLSEVALHLRNSPGATFIDASPLFPGMTSATLAKALEKHMEGYPIRFIDSQNQLQVLNTNARESPHLKNIVTILTKGQDRGTDLEMADKSTGFITLNRTTCYSEFMQAAMRMRKLGKGQQLRFFIDPQVKLLLDDNKSFSALLFMLISNESDQLKKMHSKAQPQMILAAAKSMLFQILTLLKNPKAKLNLWEKCKHLFITDRNTKPFSLENLKNEVHELLLFVDNTENSNINRVIKEGMDELNGYFKKIYLLDSIYLSNGEEESPYGYNMETENALEIQSSMQQELEIQSQVESDSPFQSLPWHTFTPGNVDELLERAPEHFLKLSNSKTHSFYDDSLQISRNLYNPDEKTYPWGLENNLDPLPAGAMKFSRIALAVSGDLVLTFIGSNKDFDHLFYPLDRAHGKCIYYIYHLENDDFEGINSQWLEHPSEIKHQIMRSVVQAKLLSGICHLTKEQKEVFEEWMAGHVNFRNIEENLLKFLQALCPSDYAHYPSSDIGLIFRALKNA